MTTADRVLVLDYDQTRALLTPDTLLPAVRAALVATSRQQASTPARIAAFSPAGLLGAMPGYVPGLGLGGKLTSVFPVADGRSAHRGLVTLFDSQDGRLRALLNGEAVTAVRTAASATVAFQALAPPELERVAVIGAGGQAHAQLILLAHLRLDAEVVVASRSPQAAAELAAQHRVGSAATIRQAIRGADAVFCCTDADRPVLNHKWLRRHAHVSSVGGSRGPEIDRMTVREGSLFVEWPGAVTCPPPAGAHELQDLPEGRAALVGHVLCGEWERPVDRMTVFKSTGYAALDVAAAAAAYDVATAQGTGSWMDF